MAQDWFDSIPSTQAPASRQGRLVRDPYKAREEERKDAAAALEAERVGLSRDAEARQSVTLAADKRKAEADAIKAEAAAAAALKEQALAPRPETARIQQSIKTSALLEALNTARRQIGEGAATGNFFGTKGFQGVPVMGQNSTNLAATISGVRGSIINDTLAQLKAQSANGASGYGSLTETEAQRLAAAVGALQQSQDKESLLTNLARVERHYRNALALSYGEDPREPDVAAKYGIVLDEDREIPGATPPSGGELTSEGRYEIDPGLSGVNSTVDRMIRDGKDEAAIRAYLNQVQPGLGDTAVNIGESINFNRQYPNDPLDIRLEQQWKPNRGVSRALGDIGMSPIGAGVIGAADTFTAGGLDNLTSNPALARAAMEGVSEENPWSYTLGQIGGGAITGLGMEAALARAGMSGIAGARTADALYGASYGAGSADDAGENRTVAALLGTGGGLVGGMLGRGAARTIGRGISGVGDAAQRSLNAAGIRMTPGQILGGGAKAVEDRLAGLPFVGDAIRSRRVESLQDFNRAAFDEALAPINGTTGGVIAEPGIDIARQLRGDAYSRALDQVRVTADAPFVGDMAAAIAAGRSLPEPMMSNMDYTLPTRVGQAFNASGNLAGRDFQQAVRGLRRDARSMENLPFGYDFGQVTRQAEGALEGLLQRQSPETMPAYRAANEANMRFETLRDAVNRARNGSRSGEVGIFAPSQLSDAAALAAKKFGNKQGTTEQPFYEMTRAAQSVLPNSIPDSGTAGRLALPAIIGSLAGGGAYATQEGEVAERAPSSLATGATVAALLSAPYSRASRDIIQRAMMAERPASIVQVGDILINRDLIAGLLARPMGAIEATSR